MFRSITVVAASGIVLMASAVSGSAASLTPTSIIGFTSSVTTLTYQQPVTFTGELAEGATPVADEPVQIEFLGPARGWATVATATTGADGQFSATMTLLSGGFVRAVFAGDAANGLGASSSIPSSGIHLAATVLPSRLLLDPIPSSVPAGTVVTFSGTLQVEVNGAWQPFAGAPITLSMEGSSPTSARYATTTGPDGSFSVTEVVSETSYWTVDTTLNGTYWTGWFNNYARAYYGLINAVSKTRITSLRTPAVEEAHVVATNARYATGTVQRWNGSSWVPLVYGWVELYYQTWHSTVWHGDGCCIQLDSSGTFRAGVGIHLGTLHWQARVVPAADTLTSMSGTTTSTITDATHIWNVSIIRNSWGSAVNGFVTDWPSSSGGLTFSSLFGLKVDLYYRAHGSSVWHILRTTTVQHGGVFNFGEGKGYGYYFMVIFPVQGPYLSTHSGDL